MKKALFAGQFLLCSIAYGQDFPRKDFALEKLADEIFPIKDDDLNYAELYENLAQLLSNPMDLNTATREQLRSLFVVKEEDINSFLQYREQNGPLLSVYEMQSVPGWTRAKFDKIIAFVTVYDSESGLNTSIFSRMLREKNNYLVLRYERILETKQGYRESTDSAQRYAGSPDKFYLRYRVARSNDFSLGFTAEKDAGEAMKWSPAEKQYGFDYLSWHAQVQNKGKIKNLIAGDFQTQFGQGLVLGSVFGFGKNAETITTVRRSNLGFLPYTSLNENLFFRGLATSHSISKNIVLHGFASKTFKDAHVQGLLEDNSSISSFSSSGLHRTPAEIRTRKQIEVTDLGAVLQFRIPTLDAGLIFHTTDFSRTVLPASSPYNQFSFRGSQNQNAAIYLNYTRANVTFFSEAAHTFLHGSAVTAGLLGNISHQIEISVLYRDFGKDFYSFHSNAFSENTSPQNEQGFYWGWKFTPNTKYSFSGYMDLFRFPWLIYRGYAASEGSEWLVRFNYTPSKKIFLFVQAREESKLRNLPDEANLYRNSNGIKRNFWINCDYAAAGLSFKTRVQFSSYTLGPQNTRGLALVQDISWRVSRWDFSLRFALFDTDDYDNRLYVYERDVWLTYTFPAYDGTGVRNYFLVQYRVSDAIDLWFRWSATRFADRHEIGTSGETIASNTVNDAKFQVRIRF
jgi:hypothetical protein